MDSSIIPLLVPKLEPNLESPEEEQIAVAAAAADQIPPPNPNPHPVKQEIASVSESEIYAEYLRISRLFQSAFAGKFRFDATLDSLPIIPAIPEPSLASAIIHGAAAPPPPPQPKRPRSSEMVRVTAITVHDQHHFRNLVRRTRIIYESLRLFLLSKDGPTGALGRRNRADLKASAVMMERGLWLNRDQRIIGSIPGIDVGDMFFFRMELCVVGLHGQVQAAIDYVPGVRSSNGEPIATSIIVSGGYEDDEDKGDMIIYTGHGGRPGKQMQHSVHQQLQGGNLALERSRYYGIEIRIIRGFKWENSPTGKISVYDGLYRIVDCWLDVGRSGFSVHKYRLLRMVGQPEMGTAILKYAEGLRSNPMLLPPGYMRLDISRGKENLPAFLFNDIDEDWKPMMFDYLVRPVYLPSTVQEARSTGVVVSQAVSVAVVVFREMAIAYHMMKIESC